MKRFFHPSQTRGFTLIELLAVVLIIGILTSVAVPQYTRSVRRAELVEGLTHGKTIYDAVLRYKSVNGELPVLFNQIDIGFIGAAGENSNAFNDGTFTYVLEGNTGVRAINNKGNYALLFQYPIVMANAVRTPIYCAPAANWVCRNAAGAGAAETTNGLEIK